MKLHSRFWPALFIVACGDPDATDESTSADEGSESDGGTTVSTTADTSATTMGTSTTATTGVDDTADSTGSEGTTSATGSSSTGEPAVCGDGAIEGEEACDDGNVDPGDGCDDACAVEAGWECTEEPSTCTAADLRVRITSTELMGTDLTVNYEVTNTGGIASGDYRVDLWRGPMGQFDAPPAIGGMGDATFDMMPGLDAGMTAMHMNVIPMTQGGSFVAYAVVDTLEAIVELDENDNIGIGHAWTTANLTVFTTFSSPDGPVDITDDAMPTVANAEVMVNTTVPNIRFSMNITHPALEELTIAVVAPNGAEITLVDAELTGANLQSTTFAAGGDLVADGTAPYVGEFAPTGMFDMMPTDDGTWQLVVTDNTPGNVGRINYFGVTFSEFDP